MNKKLLFLLLILITNFTVFAQVANPVTPLEVCDDNAPDGFAQFDLTIKNAEVLGAQNPSDFSVTYYGTQMDANADVNPLPNPYTNISNPQTVFVRVEDISTGSFDTTSLELIVEQVPIAFNASLEYCDPDSDGFGEFTLTDADIAITGGNPGLTVTYHENFSDAQNNTSMLVSPYNNVINSMQIIYARVESVTIAIDCASFTELQLVVNPTPIVPVTIDDYVVCDDNNDGFNQFNFDAVITPQIFTGGQTSGDYMLTYHTSQTDADSGNNSIVNTANYTNASNPQSIYIRLESNTSGCITTGTFTIRVELPPVIDPTYDNELIQCDDLDANYMEVNNGITVFDLTLENAEIVNGNTSWIVTYYETITDAQADINVIAVPTAYINVMIGVQTIFIRVTDNNTGCFSLTTVTIRVNPNPSPGNPNDLEQCDDNNTGDLIETFDLTENEAFILNGEPGVVSYYTSQGDAIAGTNVIIDPTLFSNTIFPQTIYVRVENDTTGCYSLVDFDLIVNPLPAFNLDDTYLLCINTNGTETESFPLIDTGLDPASYTFQWSFEGAVLTGETGPSIVATQGGNHSVLVSGVTFSCSSSDSTLVVVSAPPTVSIDVILDTITVTATGSGISLYEFSIDGGAWQSNSPNNGMYAFTGVSNGSHTITVRDINGCGEVSQSAMVALSVEEFNINSFSLYPNPANETVNIKLNNALSGNTSVEVLDIQGKRIIHSTIANQVQELQLNVSNLEAGLYFVKLKNNNKQMIKKLIIE